MGLSAALAVAQVESNPYPYRKTEINKGAWIGGFAAAGILIGGIAGSANPKWKTLYVNEQASLNNHSVKYALNLDTSINYIGLNLHFSY